MHDQISFTGRRWVFPSQHALREPLESVEEILGHFLLHRGIDDTSAGRAGMDARTFRDCDKALVRVTKALASAERMGVFGDYDCDGVTGTAILTRFLRRHGVQPCIRLPNRLTEGYGLRQAHVQEFARNGVTLLLTVDTGVTAKDSVLEAKKLGMDVVILDHHTLPRELPDAHAILHPDLRVEGAAMAAAPCGAGVAWSFVEMYEQRAGNAQWQDRDTDMTLAAIGTVADVVELRDGNRSLVQQGLRALQSAQGPLRLLCLQAGLTPPYTSRDIGFRLAPRINAAGRMADPHIALQALLGDPQALLELETLNQQRQSLVNSLMEGVETHESLGDPFICIVDEECTAGVCGLLAGKLCENLCKPTLVAAVDGGRCTASLRGIPGYDVTAALHRARHLLIDCGGHAMAAGCTFDREKFAELRDFLANDARMHVPEEATVPLLGVDAVLDPAHVCEALCAGLEALEPFGQGNAEPRFLLRNVMLTDLRTVGAEKKHLQAKLGNTSIIGFGHGHLVMHLRRPVDIACRIGTNTWKGIRRLQIMLDDARVSVEAMAAVS